MTTYGNKMWNNATDNDEKTVVPLKEKDLLKLCSLMDNAGMNYYAFSQNGNSKIAFNTRDLDWFKRIMGKEIADRLPYQKPTKPYTPPEKNIIGNVNYRYIPQKSYFKADPDIALKMAEIMEKQGIEFSGRIYSNSTAKLTVSRSDLDKLEDIQNDIIQMRKPTMEAVLTVDQKDRSKVEKIHGDIAAKRSSMAVPKKEKQQIIGNISYRDIVNMELYSPDITSERYNEIKPYLDKLVKYSGVVTDGRVVFVGEKGNTVDFINALTAAEKKCDLLKEYEQLGVLELIDERYDEQALQKLKEPLTAYANATEYERMADKNEVFTKLLNAKREIDDELDLAKIYSAHDFTDDQKKIIAEGFHNGLSNVILEQIDESFTPHQITTYFDMYDRAVKGEIDPHDIQVYLDRGRFEETLSPMDTKSVNTEDKSDSILSATTNIPDEIRDKAKKALIVNLYGGPGAGKSTTALQLVAELKKQGLHAEYVSEVAKDLVYAKAFDILDGSLENQKKILNEQKNRLDMIAGNVDVAVTDSPLLLNTVYLKEQNEEHLSNVLSQYNEYNNFNILISRDTSVPFENEGRIHNLEESMEKDREILSLLESSNTRFERFDRDNIGRIAEKITQKLLSESAPDLAEQKQAVEAERVPTEEHSFEPEKQPDSLDFHFGKAEESADRWFTESGTLQAFVDEHSEISFALANALVEYLDEKQHFERNIEELHAGWYKKTNFTIRAVVDGEEFSYEGRFDIGDGKGTGGGSIIDHIRDFNQGILDTDSYPYNTPESKKQAQETLNTFIPFLEAHSQLTSQEQELFDSFVKINPIQDERYIEARRFSKERGIPFSEYYSDGADEDFNPYAYNGSMSPEDFRKMQLLNNISDITNTEDDTPYKLIKAFEETTASVLKKRAIYDILKDSNLTEKVYAVISESDYINDKAEKEADKIEAAFEKVIENHDFSEKALEFLDRTEKQMKINGYSELDPQMYRLPPFERTYGRISRINDVIFDGKLKDIINEINENIRGKSEVIGSEIEQQQKHSEDTPDTVRHSVDRQNNANAPEMDEVAGSDNSVYLHKVGDFYEMYGKNAEIGAEVLGLHMLSKHGKPMVGFPAHVKDEYSAKLREAGYTVLTEQAFDLNSPKREPEKLTTLQEVVDKFFGTDCESAETDNGTWKLAIAGGDKLGELFYDGKAVCGIYSRGDKMEIEPYRELTTFPKLLQTAMLEYNHNKPVEIMEFQRTFETPIDKAKYLINDFCEAEYRDEADFSDLHNISIAYTTLTDDELPIQVTADLVDFKITYEFDGDVYNTEHYDSIEDMIENGLTGLDFSDLVSVPDEVIKRHTGKNEQTVELMSDTADVQGEQLSLFGDPEPIAQKKSEKPKSEFASGPVVDGVQVYEALAAEIDRGTGFVHGKLRVQDFYEEQHPTIQQLADFLKKEYGIGGHSGEGNISLVDYNFQGITFNFENGEKYRHSWYNVAVMTESRLRDDTYLSVEQKEERAALKAEQAEPHKVEVGDRFRHKITGEVSEVISLTGALPFYTDDCTVQREIGGSAVTENINYDKLLDSSMYEYIGRAEPEKEQSAPVKPAVAPETEKPDIEAERSAPDKSAPELSIGDYFEYKGDNFTITDDTLGDGGAKTKFIANIEAIKTLKTIENEHRPATKAEKETLSKYVGWGGLQNAFDSSKENWTEEYALLKELLTNKEYISARASTLDAFYTSPVVIERQNGYKSVFK